METKKHQMKILELKNTITKIKHQQMVNGFSRSDTAYLFIYLFFGMGD